LATGSKLRLEAISRATLSLRQLVSDILDTARLEAGQTVLKPAPLDIASLLERLRAAAAPSAQAWKLALRLSGSPPAQAVSCDPELTLRVLLNLVGNAVKFTPEGGTISVSALPREGGEYEFAVSDTGPGIPPDKLGEVFEKFKQLSGDRPRSGYGLGLNICKRIVELHGGRIWAESEPGAGARFVFRLPPDGRDA